MWQHCSSVGKNFIVQYRVNIHIIFNIVWTINYLFIQTVATSPSWSMSCFFLYILKKCCIFCAEFWKSSSCIANTVTMMTLYNRGNKDWGKFGEEEAVCFCWCFKGRKSREFELFEWLDCKVGCYIMWDAQHPKHALLFLVTTILQY